MECIHPESDHLYLEMEGSIRCKLGRKTNSLSQCTRIILRSDHTPLLFSIGTSHQNVIGNCFSRTLGSHLGLLTIKQLSNWLLVDFLAFVEISREFRELPYSLIFDRYPCFSSLFPFHILQFLLLHNKQTILISGTIVTPMKITSVPIL